MSDPRTLSTTTGLCPECLAPVPGAYEARDGGVHLRRECPEHGETTREVWASLDHWEWAAQFDDSVERPADRADDSGGCCCGGSCGGSDDADAAPASDGAADVDLSVDDDHACLAVVEVTDDCNLSCPFCFAGSGPDGNHRPFDEVVELLEVVDGAAGPRPIQFSGGEPTVRDDLPALVERARSMGFEHVQVNTNGIRLAEEDGYADRLADVGVSAIYLQFDGLEPETYEATRGRDLTGVKRAAVDACRAADLPVVLVPTVVPGTNDHEMGAIVDFALDERDVVESINFQPVAHFGRYADDGGRFSIDAAAHRLAEQVDALDARDLLPIPCCSTYCQFATALVPTPAGPVSLTQYVDEGAWDDLAGSVDESEWLELLAKTPEGRSSACDAAGCCETPLPGAGGLFDAVLPITITGFMDADAADAERLENCCISVPTLDDGLVPFCGYNMTDAEGRYALRNRHGWGGRRGVDAPAPARSDD